MTRFLCSSDLHLGAGADLGRVPGERLAEQEQVWARIIDLAHERDCDAILFAGDAFEGPLPTPEHYAAFARPLHGCQLPVIAVSGNGRHDAATRDVNAIELLDVIADVDRLRVYRQPAVTTVAGVHVCLLPWAPVSRIVAARNGDTDRDDVHQFAAELLVQAARDLRASVTGPAVLVTHFSISGAGLPGGMTSDELREPVLPLSQLKALGFDAIVAGHLHPPQMLDAKPPHTCPIFYCGSPLPLNFGETWFEHGVWLLDLDGFDRQAVFVPVESRPLVTLDLDARRSYEEQQALEGDPDALAGLIPPWDTMPKQAPIVKVKASGDADQARRFDLAALRENLEEYGAHHVWRIEPTIERPARARVAGLDEQIDDRQALDLWLTANDINGDQATTLRDRHNTYLETVS